MGKMFLRTHEWVEVLENGHVRIGLSDHAVKALGSIVFLGLPEIGDTLTAGEAFGEVESVKAVSDIVSPANGTVHEVNEDAADEPSLLNDDPDGTWLIELRDVGDTDESEWMDKSAYQAFLAEEG